MQRVSGSIRDLLEEFNVKWEKFAVHHYCMRQQQEYIKKIKEEARADGTVIIQMDFAENHSLIVQHEIQQAHWTTPQATIFTVHITGPVHFADRYTLPTGAPCRQMHLADRCT